MNSSGPSSWSPPENYFEWRIARVFAGVACANALVFAGAVAASSGALRTSATSTVLWFAGLIGLALMICVLRWSTVPSGWRAALFTSVGDVGVALGLLSTNDSFARLTVCATLFTLIGLFAGMYGSATSFRIHLCAVVAILTVVGLSANSAYILIAAFNVAVVSVGFPLVLRRRWHQVAALANAGLQDGLTGAMNRAGLLRNYNFMRDAAERSGKEIGVIVVDIDNFKQVNDTHGHAVGDQVIINVARHLHKHFGATSTIARIGGEEFAVLAIGPCSSLTERISTLPTSIAGGHGPTVTTSVGATTCRLDDRDNGLQAAIEIADTKMYAAKRAGGNALKLEHPTGES